MSFTYGQTSISCYHSKTTVKRDFDFCLIRYYKNILAEVEFPLRYYFNVKTK